MPWVVPRYSKGQVDAAGEVLAGRSLAADLGEVDAIIENWRSSHAFPLNTFQTSLRRKAKLVDAKATVAQRLKRRSSVRLKLLREPAMCLSQMQDIGGCRAVLETVDDVIQLRDIYQRSGLKHTGLRVRDYVLHPKGDGYRSIHLVYKYFSDRRTDWNGLRIELQFRSRLQHAWATAVEVAGTFRKQALKSGLGDARWLRFFALMSSALARREGCAPVPGAPESTAALAFEIDALVEELSVVATFNAFTLALSIPDHPQNSNAAFYLLKLDPTREVLRVKPFTRSEQALAMQEYQEAELLHGTDAVLVSVESIDELKRAYPNYFADTDVFLHAVSTAIHS